MEELAMYKFVEPTWEIPHKKVHLLNGRLDRENCLYIRIIESESRFLLEQARCEIVEEERCEEHSEFNDRELRHQSSKTCLKCVEETLLHLLECVRLDAEKARWQ